MRILLLAIACVLLGQPQPAAGDRGTLALDGPVVTAARDALRTGDFSLIAIWVKKPQEHALHAAFRHALKVRALGCDARALADTYFFETAVRLHREGEPFTGLEPAGLDPGPVVPAAERALANGSADALVEMIVTRVRAGLRERFRVASAHSLYRRGDVEAGRAYAASYTDFVHYALGLYTAASTQTPRLDEPLHHEH